MRGALLAVLVFASTSALAASGAAREEARLDLVGLRSIAGWLKAHGTEGYLGADVAQALGIGRGDAPLDARQRGFRSAAVLRIAQLLPDGSVLFMVQGADGEVTFYLSTLRAGLRRALVSIPGRGMVLPLEGEEAQANFRSEVLYWEDKAATDGDGTGTHQHH
jgi:hypothetical protein